MFWVRYAAVEHGDQKWKPFMFGYDGEGKTPVYQITRSLQAEGEWVLSHPHPDNPYPVLPVAIGPPAFVLAAARLHYRTIKGSK